MEASQKIQAHWRGGKVRNPKGFQRTRENHAATVVQSSFRGHKARKEGKPTLPLPKKTKKSRLLSNRSTRRGGTFPRDGS